MDDGHEPKRYVGRQSFIAKLDEIKAALDKGTTRKIIFEDFENQLGISYPQFCRYVKRYAVETITEEQAPKKQSAEQPKAAESKQPSSTTEKKEKPKSNEAFFHAASPNPDNLI